MKVNSSLFEKVSGSISTITGKSSSGGNCLRVKQKSTPLVSDDLKSIHIALRGAKTQWDSMSQSVRDDWGDYGRSLTYVNNTGYKVRQSGWQAFTASYIMFFQAGFDVNWLANKAPLSRGYLPMPFFSFQIIPEGVIVRNLGVAEVYVNFYLSPEQNNTINLNRKGFLFLRNQKMEAAAATLIFIPFVLPRLFIRIKIVGLDGGISLPFIQKITNS